MIFSKGPDRPSLHSLKINPAKCRLARQYRMEADGVYPPERRVPTLLERPTVDPRRVPKHNFRVLECCLWRLPQRYRRHIAPRRPWRIALQPARRFSSIIGPCAFETRDMT